VDQLRAAGGAAGVKISVIVPNFNDVRIRRSIASVRKQSHQNFELLVIDGGSTNPELLEFYKHSGADKLLIEKDGGIFDAINKGVKLASGDVIYLMGSDDELSDEKVFADVVGAFEKTSGLDGVCLGCEFVNSSGSIIRSWYPSRVTAARIKRGILPPHFSLFLKRELYTLVGEMKFREFHNVACDVIWLLDLALLKSDLRIDVLKNHHLRMEYGGASTGSMSAVANQFRVVWGYARKNARHLSFWYLYSPVRTLSKVFQFRIVTILLGLGRPAAAGEPGSSRLA
jgi:glycosyltransferase involved in cell wall biosynthesis